MKYGPIVAKRFKRQYCVKKGQWAVYPDWTVQPEQIYYILLELTSKFAIECLLNKAWTKRLPRGA